MVDESEFERLVRRDHLVLPKRIRDHELDRCLRPDEPRRQLRPAPGRKEPEEDLREPDVSHVRSDRPNRAVQRKLEAAAEAHAVDRRDRRKRQRSDPPEEAVSRARAAPPPPPPWARPPPSGRRGARFSGAPPRPPAASADASKDAVAPSVR